MNLCPRLKKVDGCFGAFYEKKINYAHALFKPSELSQCYRLTGLSFGADAVLI